MPFSNLPSEILLQISGYLPPCDLLSFVLTCRHFYDVCESALLKHQHFYSHHRTISLLPDKNTFSQFFYFLHKPHLRMYPRHIDIGEYEPGQYCRIVSPDHFQLSNDEMVELEVYMSDAHRSRVPEEMLEMWTESVRVGDEAPIIALFLTLLPNLRSLRWARLEDYPDFLSPVLGLWEDDPEVNQQMMRAGNGGSRIKEVYVTPKYEHDGAPTLTLMNISLFLALPALKTLHAEKVCDTASRSDVRLPAGSDGVCGLETLVLENSNISQRSLTPFLEPVGALKSFSYTFDETLPPWTWIWLDLANLLVWRFQYTLRELRLGLPYAISGRRELPRVIRDFKVLQVLSIGDERERFFPDDECTVEPHGSRGIAHIFNEILPPSIKEFEFKTTLADDGCLCKILNSVRNISQPWPLPHLRKTSIIGDPRCPSFTWEGGKQGSFETAVRDYLRTDHMNC